MVYNHFGPGDLDLWQFDGWQENEGGGIYFYNDWRAETPWGTTAPTMAALATGPPTYPERSPAIPLSAP